MRGRQRLENSGADLLLFALAPAGSHNDDLDIFSAVQEQLGLKLEAKKGTAEILVVDHIERPSEN